VRGLPDPQQHGHANQSLAADDRRSHLAVLPGASEEDRYASLNEVYVFNRTMRLLKYLVALEMNAPQLVL